MEKEIKLDLNETEISKISPQAKEMKWDSRDNERLYSYASIDKAKAFLDSYRFLITLSSSENIKSEILQKIKAFLENFKDIYSEVSNKYHEYTNTISNLKKQKILNRLTKSLIDNEVLINLLIDTTFPLGRKTRIYDPDQYIGVT